MHVIHNVEELQTYRSSLNGNIGFVPTMGALHDGHMALVHAAREQSDHVIASIFVNPAQFAPTEDLDTYPRTMDADIEKLKAAGCDALWAPGVEVMYPDGDMNSDITPAEVALPLEGEFRPHFFKGVVTVVYKLFDQVKPDKAFFGEKDYQQLQVIKHMVADYKMPVDIIGVPTARDENGLALSSRNQYLSTEEYEIAVHLNKVLFAMVEKLTQGRHIDEVECETLDDLKKAGFDRVDYCTVRDADTLKPAHHHPLRILGAVWLGKTRLIDNIAV